MLFRLLFIRLCPLAALRFCKDRKQIKLSVAMLLLCYGVCFLIAVGKIMVEKKWAAIVFIPLSMFPHYICYVFSIWILIRCIWCAWSERVWKRIHSLSVISVFAGILMESYWNPKILQIFFEIFK